jgi:hypothetical protein
VLALLVARILAWAGSIRVAVRERGALQTVFDGLKSLPVIHGIVRDQQEKLVVGRCAHCRNRTFWGAARDVTYRDDLEQLGCMSALLHPARCSAYHVSRPA